MCLCTGMTLSICSRTLCHDNAKSCSGRSHPKTQNCDITLPLSFSVLPWIFACRLCECSMSGELAARAVLTIAIDHLHAHPAELGPTLGAIHVTTSSILLDAFRAIRTLLGLLLNDSQTFVLFFEPIFDTRLVRFAAFVLVPRAVARNAGFGATILASANIWCART